MFLNFKLAIVAAAAIIAVGVVQELRVQGLKTELAQVQTALVDLEKQHVEKIAEQQANLLTAQENARTAEQALQDYVNVESRKKDEEIKRASALAADISQRLRNAQAEARRLATQLATSTATGRVEGTTPRDNLALVPAEIGQEDVEEAFRADEIRSSLLECYSVYRYARKTIDDYNTKLDAAKVRKAE